MPDYHYLIPEQQQGTETNLEYAIVCDTVEEAEDCFVDAKEKLMDVNNWRKYGAMPELNFQLKDSHGKDARRHARRGDHIRVDIANGAASHDWVTIEAIVYDDYPDTDMETFGMRLHPTVDASDNFAGDYGYSLHDATSTFVIQRRGRKLMATYHGRNDSGSLESQDTASHMSLGLSQLQWANLIAGVTEPGFVRK